MIDVEEGTCGCCLANIVAQQASNFLCCVWASSSVSSLFSCRFYFMMDNGHSYISTHAYTSRPLCTLTRLSLLPITSLGRASTRTSNRLGRVKNIEEAGPPPQAKAAAKGIPLSTYNKDRQTRKMHRLQDLFRNLQGKYLVVFDAAPFLLCRASLSLLAPAIILP